MMLRTFPSKPSPQKGKSHLRPHHNTAHLLAIWIALQIMLICPLLILSAPPVNLHTAQAKVNPIRSQINGSPCPCYFGSSARFTQYLRNIYATSGNPFFLTVFKHVTFNFFSLRLKTKKICSIYFLLHQESCNYFQQRQLATQCKKIRKKTCDVKEHEPGSTNDGNNRFRE